VFDRHVEVEMRLELAIGGFESAQPASFSVGQFIAVAPGVATVGVEDVLTPSGQAERVRLTACSQQTALGSCTSRVPLDIVVMP
jgi:hypothetical protein